MAGLTLFDIVGEFHELYELATDPEVDPQILADSLESVQGQLEVKASGYVQVIKQLEMEAKQADEVAKAFNEKKKIRENNIKRLKEALKGAMEATGQSQVAAGDFTIKLQKNGGLAPLTITGEVPQNMTKVIVEPDGDKIREFLKNNECEWARLEERGMHIVIK